MKVNIVCVGKIKEKYFTDAILEYKKRLSKFCELCVIEVAEEVLETNIKLKCEKEGKSLLQKCSGIIIVLDIGGEMISSTDLADFVKNKLVSGESTFSFVIGGSNGVSDEVKKRANAIFSFGKITLPHQLFRVVLSEQIYRAISIIQGLPYHK